MRSIDFKKIQCELKFHGTLARKSTYVDLCGPDRYNMTQVEMATSF